jgi:hypothetical protein
MSDDKVEFKKDAAADQNDIASNLLHCTYSILPPEKGDDRGPWQVTKVYVTGQSGDDWLTTRIENRNGLESYWATLRGVTYADIIQPKESVHAGEEIVFDDRGGGQPMNEYKQGTPEYDRVMHLVHDQIDFDSCAFKK